MASRREHTEKPYHTRLLEQVRAYEELQTILAEIKQKTSELRALERKLVDLLYPRRSLARTLHDLRKGPGKKGRPRRDDVRAEVLQLRSEGKSWAQIRQRMNGKTGKNLTVNAYRNLIQRKP